MSCTKYSVELLGQKINPQNIPEKSQVLAILEERLKNNAFISYAQNYEDVVLRRVFKNDAGVYVDVGAYDPFVKSVTCLFFQSGWSGINIDVSENNIQKFQELRPTDINICAAVGEEYDEVEFFMLAGTTRSTKLRQLGLDYESRGKSIERKMIKTIPLTAILEKNNVDKIDFLNIDVEGAEREVLAGLDLKRFRPKIILVEATYPETSKPNWHAWESTLMSAGYQCVYFDGLNRFYSPKDGDEFESIVEMLKVPPNYFDNFVRYDYILAALSK